MRAQRASAVLGRPLKLDVRRHMARRTIGLLLATLASGSAYSQRPTDVVIADVRAPDSAHAAWDSMPAVYVSASDPAKREMITAIDSALKAKQLLCLRGNSCAWLKARSRLVYLHGLLGNGQPSNDGYVCPNTPTIPRLKYYSTNFVTGRPCLPMFWDAQTHSYSVSDR